MKFKSHTMVEVRRSALKEIVFVLFVLLFNTVSAQNFENKFGKCSQAELEMASCPYDSTADAMVLYDEGDTYFSVIAEKYQIIFDRKIKYKFFNKAGIDDAKFEIRFYDGNQGSERVSYIKCNTYNLENGKVVVTKLENKNIFDEKSGKKWLIKKFAMPAVREGSVVEVSYRITSPYLFSLPSWKFQAEIPVMYSRYKVTVNPHFEYTFMKKGDLPLGDYKKYELLGIPTYINQVPRRDVAYEYVMNNVPAFRNESYITSYNDYINKLDVQISRILYNDGSSKVIMSSWPKLSEDLESEDNFGAYIKAFSKDDDVFISMDGLPQSDSLKLIKFIDQYIKKNYTYNGDDQYFASGSKKDIEKLKKGNSADLNLMAVGMLRAAGYNAYPALLSTRENGKVNSAYPFLDAFDYVIAIYEFNNELKVMDVTDPMLRFGDIPPKCLNDVCLLLKSKDVEWLGVKSNDISNSKFIKVLTPLPGADSLLIDNTLTTTYFDAYNMRKDYKSDYEDLASSLLGSDYSLYDSIRCKNLEVAEEDFILTYSKKVPLEVIENMILIEPFEGEVMTENPLKQPVRTYPIDIGYRYSKSFSVDIIIPEGYKVAAQPENLVVNNQDIRIVYTVSTNQPSKVNIMGIYQFKKDVYDCSSYNNIKGYIDIIVNKFNEKLVLEAAEI